MARLHEEGTLHCWSLSAGRSSRVSFRDVRGVSRALRLLLIATAALSGSPGWAADPQSYTVAIAPTQDAPLDSALKESSQLESLRRSGPVSPLALIGRAREDVTRLKTVLESFGYYQGQVSVTVSGKPLDDPDLPDAISVLPTDRAAVIAIVVEPGQLYHLRRITIDGEVSDSERGALGLQSGGPANAVSVLEAQARLLNALQEDGYAFAKVDAPVAYEDPTDFALDVVFRAARGERANIGDIRINGLKRVHESLVRKRLLLRSGEPYSPGKIDRARRDLLALGVFSGVTVRADEQPDAAGRVPVTITVQERLRHTLGFNTAYSTDLGGSAGVKWTDRDLFGGAEQLNLAATAIDLGGHATTGVGYNVAAQLVKPDYRVRDQSLQLNVATLKQSLQAYDQTAVTASTLVTRRFTPDWTASAGLSAEREQITQEGVVRDYTLLGVPLNARYNSTGLANPLEDAVHGVRASVSVTPTKSLTVAHATFVVAQADAAAYVDLAGLGWSAPGRSVVAVRALVGQVRGAGPFDLPPDQRFYGGGSTTVRGFRYQSIGPRFPDGNPTGGTAIDAGTLEYRQRIAKQLGLAIFVDAGSVSGDGHPLQGRPSAGAGIGVRYYTPIGPIRLDVAVPVTRLPGGDAFEIYIGLGQVF
jgi:translocation and assembly module TamA